MTALIKRAARTVAEEGQLQVQVRRPQATRAPAAEPPPPSNPIDDALSQMKELLEQAMPDDQLDVLLECGLQVLGPMLEADIVSVDLAVMAINQLAGQFGLWGQDGSNLATIEEIQRKITGEPPPMEDEVEPGDQRVSATSARSRQSIKLYRLDALPELPHREEIIENLLATGEIAALVGPAGEGKSSLLQLLATCIAEGRPFLGRSVVKGPAIYVAAERGSGSTRRLLAIRRNSNAPLFIASARPNLAKSSDVEELARHILQACEIEQSSPVLIVIDTLARCMPGLDENSARDMGMVIEGLTRLAEMVPSAAVIFAHHTGKGGSGEMRGSTALVGGIDLELCIEAKGKFKRLSVGKANEVSEEQHLDFQLKPIEYQEYPDADVETVIAAFEASEPNDCDRPGPGISDGASPRSELILSLVEDLATDGKVDRMACLAAARDRGIVKDPKPENGPEKALKNTAEQFRKALVELKGAGLIQFDSSTISVGVGLPPHQPHGPP